MIVAIVFAGMLAGISSAGVVFFVLDFGWLLGIAGFYAGAFVGMGLAALRVAALSERRDHGAPRPVHGSAHSRAA